MLPVIGYLIAACAANVVVTVFGYSALPFTAFAIIPFDLTTRDVLHERWHGNWLALKMTALVIAGSFLAWLFCNGSTEVCVASAISFAVAGIVDSVIYHILSNRTKWLRMNLSNVLSCSVDSICFPMIAFGTLSLSLASSQIALKIIGGALWVSFFLWMNRNANTNNQAV